MAITRPFCRLWRPLKGYEYGDWYDNDPHPSIEYLDDNRFACQAEMESLVTTAHLIVRDLYVVFNYVEPCDANLSTYSHRMYELLLRTATDFESNCKGILRDNAYQKAERDMNILDYFRIAAPAKLSDYSVSFNRWDSNHIFRPFAAWNNANYVPLPWYQSYNTVKHNRYANFNQANLGNLMDAIAGLLCILHAQIGENMDRTCFEGDGEIQMNQEEVTTGTFTIRTPHFLETEQYEFFWDNIKSDPDPVQRYAF